MQQNIKIGTLVGDPEIESDADLNGLSGRAAITSVSGIYASTGANDLDSGVLNCSLSMSADFGTSAINGCVGCNGIGPNLDSTLSPENYPYRFRLGQATINDNGRIEDGTVTVETGVGTSISTNSGSWSGRFSNRNINGRPRAVAGTLGSSFTVGSFLSP